MEEVIKEIKKKLAKKKKTQAELAKMIGVSDRIVSMWMTGKVQMRLDKFLKIKEVLK